MSWSKTTSPPATPVWTTTSHRSQASTEPGSHLANVSSLFGLIAPAGQAAYAASKFTARGFTEALRHEFADNGIGVTSIHPGGIRTRIAESARMGSGVGLSREEEEDARAQCAALLSIDPAHAADIIVKGIERRRGRVLIGRSAKILDMLARLLPASYGKILAAATRAWTKSAPATRRPCRRQQTSPDEHDIANNLVIVGGDETLAELGKQVDRRPLLTLGR